ncbi:MAG: EAL domain-containing protein [Pseudomonadota bacterium]
MDENEQHPTSPWKIYALAVGTGLVILLLLFSQAWMKAIGERQQAFEFEASQAWEYASQRVENGNEALQSLGALYLSSLDVSATQFQNFAKEILGRHSFIRAVAYLPRVTQKTRDGFEREVRESGFASFVISRSVAAGGEPAAPAKDYFPVLHIEPFEVDNAALLGMDTFSDPAFRAAIEQAIETAAPVPAGGNIPSGRKGYWLFKATYAGTEIPRNVTERRNRANGAIAFMIDPAGLLEPSLLPAGVKALIQIFPTGDSAAGTVRLAINARRLDGSIGNVGLSRDFDMAFPGYRFGMSVSKPLRWQDIVSGTIGIALFAGFSIVFALYLLARGMVERAREASLRAIEIRRQVSAKTQALQENGNRIRMIIDSALDSVITMDMQGRITDWNPQAEIMFGWPREEAIGRDVASTIIPLRHRHAHTVGVQRFLEKGEGPMVGKLVELSALHRDGREFPIELTVSAIWVNGEYTFTAFIRDITERKQIEEQLADLASYDSVTRLPNRVLFKDRLMHAMVQQGRHPERQIALLFLDLDHFKTVNDTLGHTIGDKLLQAVANQIRIGIRKGDTISRLGGDEFTIILESLHHTDDAAVIAQKILDNIAVPFNIEGHEIFVSATIGITIYPNDAQSADDLLRNADTAMYQAKERGRGRYLFFTSEMNARMAERLKLENSLRRALERNEFRLHYQPQVDLATGRITGMETLIRWEHPDVGLVPPFQFIPIAEETGLIVPIGEWVLQTACAQNKAWQEAGLPAVRVAVNLSGHQFGQQNLAKIIEQTLNDTGLDARYLELEITESVAMENAEKTIAALQTFKTMGIGISIDDFGTGYSSLSYLKRFPIDTLKIDRSFVKDVTDDPEDAAIASATIAMAHNLKLKVIAEGVETAEQLAFLQKHACDEIQGYYFSKPVPADDFAKLLQQGAFPLPAGN